MVFGTLESCSQACSMNNTGMVFDILSPDVLFPQSLDRSLQEIKMRERLHITSLWGFPQIAAIEGILHRS